MDGDLIGSGITGPNIGRNALTDKPLIFGIYLETGQHGQWGSFLGAIIDEVVIFNTALSETDINTIMDDGLQTVADIQPAGKLT